MHTIAVVCGGDAGEFEVSMRSADMVVRSMDTALFTPYKIVLDKQQWNLVEGKKKYPVDKNDFSVTKGNTKIRFDAAYIIVHGTPGEDGKLQGYLDMLNIPYTTPNVTVSAVTMNKYLSKKIASSDKIPVAKGMLVKSHDETIDIDYITEKLGLPCFVKPNNGGSSVATFKIYKKKDMMDAIEAGFEVENEVIIEEFIQGKEVTIGVYRNDNGINTLPITEIVPHNDFFDYDAKYNGESDEITPARIDKKMETKIRKTAAHIYDLFHIEGLVRIDFMIRDNTAYFMEVNTTPGFTENSLLPQQIRAAGMLEKDVITEVILLSLDRKRP